MMSVPKWPPRDWRALLALCASIVGSASLTCFAGAIVWILWKGGWAHNSDEQRIALLGKALILSLLGGLIVLVSLGLAINRREIRVSRQGFEMSGGDDDGGPPQAPTVTTTTEVKP